MSDRGAAAVEFALVLPVVLLAIVLVVEVVGVAHTQMTVTAAAREGARVAATTPDPGLAAAAVRRALGDRADEARITVRRPDVVGETAEVVVALRHAVAAAVAGDLVELDVHGRAVMRVER